MKVRSETIQLNGHLYVIVTDTACGRRGRYTVHRIDLFGMNNTRVIGRELDLPFARKLVVQDDQEFYA